MTTMVSQEASPLEESGSRTGPPKCEDCSERAWVHLADQIPGQGPVVKHLCFRCAEQRNPVVPVWRMQRTLPLSDAAILIANGVFIVTLSIFADQLRLGGTKGFGLYQLVGVVLSMLLLIAGGLLRAPTVVLMSMMLGGLTLVADILKLGLMPGFGWHQFWGIVFGMALILFGLVFGLIKASKK